MRDLLDAVTAGYVFAALAAAYLGFIFSPVILAITLVSYWPYLGMIVTLPVGFGVLFWMDEY